MWAWRDLLEDARLGGHRGDGVDGDVVLGDFLGERLGQRDDAGLRGRVGGGGGVALLAGDRGDVGDAAVVARDHAGHDGAAADELAAQVDADDAVPFLDRIFGDLGVQAGDAGVVDQDVDLAKAAIVSRVRRSTWGFVGDIDGERDDLAARRQPSPAVASASALSRSQMATAAPPASSRSTTARPMPWAPPVTTAARLAKSNCDRHGETCWLDREGGDGSPRADVANAGPTRCRLSLRRRRSVQAVAVVRGRPVWPSARRRDCARPGAAACAGACGPCRRCRRAASFSIRFQTLSIMAMAWRPRSVRKTSAWRPSPARRGARRSPARRAG